MYQKNSLTFLPLRSQYEEKTKRTFFAPLFETDRAGVKSESLIRFPIIHWEKIDYRQSVQSFGTDLENSLAFSLSGFTTVVENSGPKVVMVELLIVLS